MCGVFLLGSRVTRISVIAFHFYDHRTALERKAKFDFTKLFLFAKSLKRGPRMVKREKEPYIEGGTLRKSINTGKHKDWGPCSLVWMLKGALVIFKQPHPI